MDIKQAARAAKEYVGELFSEEEIINVGLEGVDFDDQTKDWEITIGFSRPWEQDSLFPPSLGDGILGRSYWAIRISDESGQVKSLVNLTRQASG